MAHTKPIRTAARALRHWAAACTLAALSPLALAATVSSALVAGHAGDLVSPVVVDSALTAFEAADLTITFDPAVLLLVGASPGPAFSTGSLLLGSPSPAGGGLQQVLMSLAIANGPFDGIDVTMFTSQFRIQAGAAPGFTTVRFETLDPLLYDIRLDAQVQVLANAVPEAGTGWLVVAAGGAALVLTRRRRRAA